MLTKAIDKILNETKRNEFKNIPNRKNLNVQRTVKKKCFQCEVNLVNSFKNQSIRLCCWSLLDLFTQTINENLSILNTDFHSDEFIEIGKMSNEVEFYECTVLSV